MKNTKLEEKLLIKLLLNLVIFKKLYLVKMCPIFASSQLETGAKKTELAQKFTISKKSTVLALSS